MSQGTSNGSENGQGGGSGGFVGHAGNQSVSRYGDPGLAGFISRSFAKSMGFSDEDLRKPVIGIAQTWSEFNNCHQHFKELAEAVKRGVWQAGGLPLEFPTISLGEIFLSPTSMFFRNLMAIDTEEMIKAQPMNGVVLLGACDKTIPARYPDHHVDGWPDPLWTLERPRPGRLHGLPGLLDRVSGRGHRP
jgi:dihydroxy-acid dehydratase